MIKIDYKQCDTCGGCVSVCECGALMIVRRLEIDPQRCVQCYKCIDICPVGALEIDLPR